ncbi:MAG: GspE/PulE family protein [Phycisphaerales bacterium]
MPDHDDFVIASLVEEGRLDPVVVDEARRAAASRQVPPLESLVSSGVLTHREIAVTRASICECPFVDLAHYTIDIRNSDRIGRSVAESLRAFPLFDLGEMVTVGMANPLDLRAVDQLRAILKAEVEVVLCEPAALAGLIERSYALAGRPTDKDAALAQQATLTTGKEPIVAAVNQLLAAALERGASDVHIGPDETVLHIRFRIDGVLEPQQGPGLSAHTGIVQRLKVMANLDLTQTRRPQDGKFRFTAGGRSADIRLSLIPTVCGENVVMRLLTSAGSIKGFADLGIAKQDLARFESMLDQPNGMVLVTGPTGSGKTTTLYTALKRMNTPDVNVMTVEDPVEIRMPLMRQVQVNAEIGMTFAGALRSILRQDPDVVLVGEIRDEETARIALQAALTGHLVLSSLHTNDAAGSIPRLADLGCPAFAINAALLGVMAQRLVKRNCPDCTKPATPDPLLLARFGLTETQGNFAAGGGCARCAGTGSRGRMGIYELLAMTPTLQRLVDKGAGGAEVRERAVSEGMTLMWQDGLNKARVGLTTLGEVARVAAIAHTAADETAEPAQPRRAA